MNNKADQLYKEIVEDIHQNGDWDYEHEVRGHYADGEKAHSKSLFGYQLKFTPEDSVVLSTKKVGYKTAFKEIYLFAVKQTTKAEDFEQLNMKIWREWYDTIDGVKGIGRSYGYQLKKYKQMERLLEQLANNPGSRRHLISYWNEEDKPKKALQECAWAMQFDVRKGRLDMILIQRSVDVALGLPFNWVQYRALQQMIAHHLGLKLGWFTHQMGNVHYYDRHEEAILGQVQRDSLSNPQIVLPEKSFFDYGPDDISLTHYEHGPKTTFEVSI